MSGKIVLACDRCGSRNYKTTQTKDQSVRLELKKYCPVCKIHTTHKQS